MDIELAMEAVSFLSSVKTVTELAHFTVILHTGIISLGVSSYSQTWRSYRVVVVGRADVSCHPLFCIPNES
jgi:hypothetical protein